TRSKRDWSSDVCSSDLVPWLTQNTDSYLPANAFPNPSSRKLEERTMIGLCPKYSSTDRNFSRISAGNSPESNAFLKSSAFAKYRSEERRVGRESTSRRG